MHNKTAGAAFVKIIYDFGCFVKKNRPRGTETETHEKEMSVSALRLKNKRKIDTL